MNVVDDLLQVMAALRDPEHGCPWDLRQDFHTIAPHTVEEAYEVVEAIERGTPEGLRDELGDLLLQVVYHARMAEERGWFDFEGVAEAIRSKLIRRHPHVFGASAARDLEAIHESWESIKAAERREKGEGEGTLDGIAAALPALARASKLQRRAARVGFDWPDHHGPLKKIEEETDEIVAEIEGGDPDRLESEVGDLLFACVNLARHLGVDPETALRRANHRFEERFRGVEAEFRERGEAMAGQEIDALEAAWQRAKARLRQCSGGAEE